MFQLFFIRHYIITAEGKAGDLIICRGMRFSTKFYDARPTAAHGVRSALLVKHTY